MNPISITLFEQNTIYFIGSDAAAGSASIVDIAVGVRRHSFKLTGALDTTIVYEDIGLLFSILLSQLASPNAVLLKPSNLYTILKPVVPAR